MMNSILKRQLLTKKKGRKGFTLIEVIVVLVILAILAAIAIPSLTGYIDKAREKAVISEARTIQVALQEIAADAYGRGVTPAVIGDTDNWSDPVPGLTGRTVKAEIEALTGKAYTTQSVGSIGFDGTALIAFVYSDGTWDATYSNGSYTVAKAAVPPSLAP
jgi:type IV pilus assembly protein PilA